VSAWEKLDPMVARASDLSCGAAGRPGEGTGWRAGTIRKLDMVCDAANDLVGAVRARDAERALDANGALAMQQRMAADLLSNERRRPRGASRHGRGRRGGGPSTDRWPRPGH
jgi:hypothetical protein